MKLTPIIAMLGCTFVAACETSAPATGPSSAVDTSNPEQTCAGVLAETANVRMSDIRPTTTDSMPGGGYEVGLSLNGAPWVCRVDAAGNASVEFQGEG